VAADLDTTFAALADPTRRSNLERLAEGEATASELAAPFAISKPAVSKHLNVLERAGLISRHREAQWKHAKLEVEPLAEAVRWLEGYSAFWDGSFDKLADHLENRGRGGGA